MSTVSSAPTAAAVEAPVGPDAARALIAGGALTDAPIGPVGLELERHVVDLASPVRSSRGADCAPRRPAWPCPAGAG